MSLLNMRTISAIQAVRVLACNPGKNLTVRQVARMLHVPTPFLRKVAQKLAAVGVIELSKQPRDCIRIVRPAQKNPLLKIFEALEEGHNLKVSYF